MESFFNNLVNTTAKSILSVNKPSISASDILDRYNSSTYDFTVVTRNGYSYVGYYKNATKETSDEHTIIRTDFNRSSCNIYGNKDNDDAQACKNIMRSIITVIDSSHPNVSVSTL